MNIIKNTQTNEVLWYGADEAYINNGAFRTAQFNLGISSNGATYVENVEPIEQFFLGAYAYDNGWSIFNQEVYDQAVAYIAAQAAAKVRAKRDVLLQESDWTQLPDVPLANKATWATYREDLRNIPSQPGFPFNVTWPITPSVPSSNQPITSGTQDV